MRWTTVRTAPAATSADLLIVGVLQGDAAPDVKPWKDLDKAVGGYLRGLKGSEVFDAAADGMHTVPGGDAKAPWVLLVGLGPADDLTLQSLRCSIATAIKRAVNLKAKRVALAMPWESLSGFSAAAVARSCAEGGEMALFEAGSRKVKTAKKRLDPATVKVCLGDGVVAAFAVPGGRRSDFEGGAIRWDAARDVTEVLPR